MKKSIYITALSFILCSCSGQTKKEEKKSVDSKKDEWISLFDGKTTNGWHYYNGGKIGDEWQVKDGTLTFDPRNKKEGAAFAEIFAALDVAEDSKTFTRVLIKSY